MCVFMSVRVRVGVYVWSSFVESVTWPECVYALCVHVYVCV